MDASLPDGEDFTYGDLSFKTPTGTYDVRMPKYFTNNAEIMVILLDQEKWPGAPALDTINKDHVKNPQRRQFSNAQMVTDSNAPGVGPLGVYRDPWGNPYVITIDLTNDEKARDVFYRTVAVSADPTDNTNNPKRGLNGLIPTMVKGNATYEANSAVMVWSAGPDKMIDPTAKANQGANKDNVISWKQ